MPPSVKLLHDKEIILWSLIQATTSEYYHLLGSKEECYQCVSNYSDILFEEYHDTLNNIRLPMKMRLYFQQF